MTGNVYCRFNDIDISVRRICVQSVHMLIVNHPELVGDLVGEYPLIIRNVTRTGMLN